MCVPQTGISPLHLAAKEGHVELCEHLVENGASPGLTTNVSNDIISHKKLKVSPRKTGVFFSECSMFWSSDEATILDHKIEERMVLERTGEMLVTMRNFPSSSPRLSPPPPHPLSGFFSLGVHYFYLTSVICFISVTKSVLIHSFTLGVTKNEFLLTMSILFSSMKVMRWKKTSTRGHCFDLRLNLPC